jgi:ADP-heptose:LPS heptosyltransferase
MISNVVESSHGQLFLKEGQVLIASLALQQRFLRFKKRELVPDVRSILVIHQLFLGDAIMLTPLLARLRGQYPAAKIVVAMPWSQVPIYSGLPFGVQAFPFDAKGRGSIDNLLRLAQAQNGFDLAIVPGENRYAWHAAACDARWIVGFSGGDAYKTWPLDEQRGWPDAPMSLPNIFASLAPASGARAPATLDAWPAPPAGLGEAATAALEGVERYAVLHVGASNPKKFWAADNWAKLAQKITSSGLKVVWSAGKNETHLLENCGLDATHINLAGKLDLGQMWHLLNNAAFLVAPDTGIAHLARLTQTPAITLFGAGPTILYAETALLSGINQFHPLVLAELPERYQTSLFKRPLNWLQNYQAFEGLMLPNAKIGAGFDAVWDKVSSLQLRKQNA